MSPESASFTFIVVAEAHADKRIATDLAERILVDEVDWIENEGLPQLIRWQGFDASTEYTSWAGIGKRYQESTLSRVHSNFRGERGVFDEIRAKKALRLCTALDTRPTGILMVRDTDGQDERLASLERARGRETREFAVILALPHPKREAWVLAGFDPESPREETALEEARRRLGFDPRHQAERLTASGRHGKRNAKTILEHLLDPGTPREEACWQSSELEILEQRGQRSGLADYLAEVRGRLIPPVAGSR